jgi:CRISPR-associated protein Cas1
MAVAMSIGQAYGRTYGQSNEKYAAISDKKEAASSSVVLTGYGICMKVDKSALAVKDGFSYDGQKTVTRTLYKGIHGIDKIIILSTSGILSLDALKWCKDENICVVVIDQDGHLQSTITSEALSNISLRRKQYSMEPSKIAYQLLYEKTCEQMVFLENNNVGADKDRERVLQIFLDSFKWLNVPGLPRWKDINYMRTFEARLAKVYWYLFEKIEVRFSKSDMKNIPPHWLKSGTRGSMLSHNHGARNAVTPFHALLNYGYAVVESQIRSSLTQNGLDLSCGFLHADKTGRDSLVYDIIELFRSKVDSRVLKLVQKTTFRQSDFMRVKDGSIRLVPQLAKYTALTCVIDQKEVDSAIAWLKALLLSSD